MSQTDKAWLLVAAAAFVSGGIIATAVLAPSAVIGVTHTEPLICTCSCDGETAVLHVDTETGVTE